MKSVVNIAIAVTVVFISFFEVVGQGASVSPTKIFFDLTPGSSKTQKITLSNNGNRREKYNISIADWTRDSLGQKIYYSGNTLSSSCANWITLSENLVELNPGESKQIDLIMKRPSGTEEAVKWAILFIEPTQEVVPGENASNLQSKINVKYRIGVLLYQAPPTLSYKNVDILNFKVIDGKKVFLKVKNTEQTMADARVNFELVNLSNGQEFDIEEKGISILPLAMRVANIDLPNLPAGEYSLLAIIDYGMEYDIVAAETEFVIK